MLVPVAWMEEGAEVDDAKAGEFRHLYLADTISTAARIGGPVLCAVATVAFLALF